MGIVAADYLIIVIQGMITVCAPATVLRVRCPKTYVGLATVGVAAVVLLRPEFGVANRCFQVAAELLSLLMVTFLPFCLLKGSVFQRLLTLCVNCSNMVVCEMVAYAMLEVHPGLRRRMIVGEALRWSPPGELAGVLCVKAWSLILLLFSVLVMKRYVLTLFRALSTVDGAALGHPMRLRTLLLCCVVTVVSCGFLVPGTLSTTSASYLSVLATSCVAVIAFLACDCLIVMVAKMRIRSCRKRSEYRTAHGDTKSDIRGYLIGEEDIREAMKMRHDLNNQLAVVRVLSEEGDWDGALGHVRALKSECESAIGRS